MPDSAVSCPSCNEPVCFPPLSTLTEAGVVTRLTCISCEAVFLPIETASGGPALYETPETLAAPWYVPTPRGRQLSPYTHQFSPEFLTRYALVGLAGKGAMGAVFLMRQAHIGRLVAVKVMRADGFGPEAGRRLLKEGVLLAQLDHPGIVAVHEVGYDRDQPFLVTAYVRGETLRERLRYGALEVDLAVELGIRVASALAVAHQKGIVHRDLKPANLFLSREGNIKIGDFGVAKYQAMPSVTGPGMLVGTPQYMSPEQCRGSEITPASDLYALGVVLYEALTGRRPFAGPKLEDFLHQHQAVAPVPPVSVRSDIPIPLQDLVLRLLSKAPRDRTEGAKEVGELLRGMRPGPVLKPSSRPGVAPLSAAGSAPAVGDLLGGRYVLVRHLGPATGGAYWTAKDTAREGVSVTIRFLPAQLWQDPGARARMGVQVTRALMLGHENVLKTYNLEPGPPPFLVTELISGLPLAQELARQKEEGSRPLRAREALPLVEAMAAGLDHAHERGVVHGLLTPADILLETSPRGEITAKISDFGLAAEIQSLRNWNSRSPVSETLPYSSPECVTCQQATPRSDVYSLAAVVYHLLTLMPPWIGANMAYRIEKEPATAPPGVSTHVGEVILRGLAKNPAQRPATGREFYRMFREAVDGEPPPRIPTAPGVAPSGPVSIPPMPSPEPEPPVVVAPAPVAPSSDWSDSLVAVVVGVAVIWGLLSLMNPPPAVAPGPSAVRTQPATGDR